MLRSTLLLATASAALCGLMPENTAGLTPQDFVNAHNEKRCLHGSPAVVWDADVAASARAWAGQCKFEHSSGSGNGENLAWMSGSSAPPASRSVQMWYDEISDYDYSNPGFSGATGHFTQVVWKDSTRIGCGVCDDTARGRYIVTCQYAGPGNYNNQYAAQVPALNGKTLEQCASGGAGEEPEPVPVEPCTVGKWSSWSACDKSCGVGSQTRTRSVTGQSCPEASQTDACNDGECPTAPSSGAGGPVHLKDLTSGGTKCLQGYGLRYSLPGRTCAVKSMQQFEFDTASGQLTNVAHPGCVSWYPGYNFFLYDCAVRITNLENTFARFGDQYCTEGNHCVGIDEDGGVLLTGIMAAPEDEPSPALSSGGYGALFAVVGVVATLLGLAALKRRRGAVAAPSSVDVALV
jgi:hypothetical protein